MAQNPDDEEFDFNDHIRRLREAEDVLRHAGHHQLAGAVGREISLHHEFMTRLNGARNVERQIGNLHDKLGSIRREMGEYVTGDRLPWLLPKGKMWKN